MKTLPSKELLSAVLGIELLNEHGLGCDRFEIKGKNLAYRYTYDYSMADERSINIYELMHLMKEWAYKYGFEMVSYHIQDSSEYRCLYAHLSIDLNKDKRIGFYADTEFEAISKACEWILKGISK